MITVRTTPGKIPAFDVRALEARLAAVSRRWEDDLKGGAGRRIRRSAWQRTVQAIRPRVSGRIPGGFLRARRGSGHRADGGADAPRSRWRCPCIARSRPRRACFASSSTISAGRSRCPTACPCSSTWASRCSTSARTASRRSGARRSGCTTWACSRRGPRYRSRDRLAARGIRVGIRTDFPRRGRERRIQPPGRRGATAGAGNRDPARMCEVHAPDRLSVVAGIHPVDAGRACRTSPGNWSSCSRCASIPKAARVPARARPSRCARSKPRSMRSRIFRRIGCCASIWR